MMSPSDPAPPASPAPVHSQEALLLKNRELSEAPSLTSNSGIVLAAAISAMTAATLGYDVGIMADAIEYIKDGFNLSDSTEQFLVGSLNFVAGFGTLVAGYTSDKLGRKPTVKICCALYLVGTTMMTVAQSYLMLLAGRIITGIGVGVSFVVTPVYIAEITPSALRGTLGVCFDISINCGIVLGYIVGLVVSIVPGLGGGERWRAMLGAGAILPVIVIVFLSALPESPRFLMKSGREDEARVVLGGFLKDDQLADDTIEEIREAIDQEGAWQPLSWSEFLFPRDQYSRNVRNLALFTGFWQQASGSEAVLYYSGEFLANAGLKSNSARLLGFIGIGLCKLIPEAIVMLKIEEVGRRPFMVWSSAAMTLVIACLGLVFLLRLPSPLVVVMLCAFMCAFSTGVGPITWVTVSECTPLRQRAKGMTLCCFINRAMSGAVALSALSTSDALGYAGFFFLYAGVSAVATAYYYSAIPETKGKTLEQITTDLKLAAGESHDLLTAVNADTPSSHSDAVDRDSRASRHSYCSSDVGRGVGRVSF